MSLEVVVPEEYMSAVIGDISSRRGKILEWRISRIPWSLPRILRWQKSSVIQLFYGLSRKVEGRIVCSFTGM